LDSPKVPGAPNPKKLKIERLSKKIKNSRAFAFGVFIEFFARVAIGHRPLGERIYPAPA